MTFTKWAALVVASLGASMASAATTWGVADFLDSSTSTAQAASAAAWSTTGGSGDYLGTFQTSCLHDYGSTAGWGIVNTAEANPCTGEPGTGPHAADNVGATDAFVLRFASETTLSSIAVGWNGTDNYSADSDISVLAYTGTSNPAPIGGLTAAQLLDNSWTLIGNYGGIGALTNNTLALTTTVSSSWWLISAYNSGFGTTSANGSVLGNGNDYIKLLSVAGTVATTPPPTPNGVPEPGSLALAGLGLFALARRQRRRTASA